MYSKYICPFYSQFALSTLSSLLVSVFILSSFPFHFLCSFLLVLLPSVFKITVDMSYSMTSCLQTSSYLSVCVCVYSSFSLHRENFSPVQSLVSLSPFTNRPPASDLTYSLVLGCTTMVFNRVSLSLHWLLLSPTSSDIYSVNMSVTCDLLPIQQRLYRMFII